MATARTVQDQKVRVTAADTTRGYLDEKLLVGAGLSKTIVTPGGDEDLRVDITTISDGQHGARGGGTLHALASVGLAGFMSAADKVILDGLASGSVPSTRLLTAGAGLTGGGDLSADRTFNVIAADASIVVNANDLRVGVLQTDAMHGARGGGTQHAAATVAVAGFMSAADKVKLDGIATGATVDTKEVQVSANDTTPAFLLAKVVAGANITVTEINDGGNETLSIAAAAGVGSATPSQVDAGDTGTAGASSNASREDHQHGVNTGSPSGLSVGQATGGGASAALVRADHSHGVPAAAPAALSVGAVGGAGASSSFVRADHEHAVTAGAPVSVSDSTNSAGAAATFVRSDHVHAHGSRGGGSLHAAATPSVAGFMSAADKTKLDLLVSPGFVDPKQSVRAATTAAGALASDFESGDTIDAVVLATGDRILIKNQASPIENGIYTVNASGAPTRATDLASGDAAAGVSVFVEEGAANGDTGWLCTTDQPTDIVGTDPIAFAKFSESTVLSGTAPVDVDRAAASAGVSAEASRQDHKHDVSTASAVDLTDATSAEGVAVSLARSDHTHSHGARGGGSLHALAIASGAAGFMSGADKAKLDGIAAGAAALTATPPVDVTRAAAVVGVGTTAARHDHKHDVSTAAAVELTDSTNAEGAATSLARSDHTHAHGVRGGGTLHAVVIPAGAAGFMSGADKTKLDAYPATPSLLTHTQLTAASRLLDEHANHWFLPGRAGGQGQVIHGGTAAGNLVVLQGSSFSLLNAGDTGRIHINSPVEYFYDTASNTTPVEQYLIRWRPTGSVGAYIGGYLRVDYDLTTTSTTYIPGIFVDGGTSRIGATPAFAAYTFINVLHTIANSGNFNLCNALVANVGIAHERNTAGTSTVPSGTTGMNFSPQSRTTIAGAVLTKLVGDIAVSVAPTYSTVAGSTINGGTIIGMRLAPPAPGIFAPAAGTENYVGYIGVDFLAMTHVTSGDKVVVRSAMTAAGNRYFLQNNGGAQSTFGGGNLLDCGVVQILADNTSLSLGAAGGDVQVNWNGTALEWDPLVGPDMRWRPFAAYWQLDGSAAAQGLQIQLETITFGTTTADPATSNFFVQFAAPNLRSPTAPGEYSDVHWTAGGSIAIGALAMSNVQAFKVNSPAVTLAGGSIADLSNFFIEAMPSFGATRMQALRVLGRSRLDGLMTHNEATLAQLTASVAALALPPNNAGRFVLLIDADALGPWTIQGIVNVQVGDAFYIVNTGANALLLGHQDGAAAAADRIISPTGAALTLAADEMAKLWYDPVATRWRILEHTGA